MVSLQERIFFRGLFRFYRLFSRLLCAIRSSDMCCFGEMRFSMKMKKYVFKQKTWIFILLLAPPKDSTRELFWFVCCSLSYFFCVRSDQRRQSSRMTVWRNLFQSSRISFDAFRLPFCPSLSSLLHSSDALFAFFLLIYLVASWCCCCCFFFGVTTKNFYWRSSPLLPTPSSDCAFFRPSCLARTWCIGCTGEE